MKYWGVFGQYIIISLFMLVVIGFSNPVDLGGLIVYSFFLPAFMVGCTIMAFNLWIQIAISFFCIIILPWYVDTYAPWYADKVLFMFDPVKCITIVACLNLLFTVAALFYYPKHYYCQRQQGQRKNGRSARQK